MAYSFPAAGCYKITMIMATTLLLLVVSISISSAFPTDEHDQKTAYDIVQKNVKIAIDNETRMGASLLRLHFHDCFVNGCDGSILLDNTTRTNGEKPAPPNLNSARGFDVIDRIKSDLEAKLPGAVSCADILAIAARDVVKILGGPYWDVKIGRLDSLKASQNDAKNGIPPPTSSIYNLTTRFGALGLSKKDLVALSGSHTIGQARCTTFRGRLYNKNSTIDKNFAGLRQKNCPSRAGQGDNNLAPLDLGTPTSFDNRYYINLVKKEGLLNSDQVLYSGGDTESANIVEIYANNQTMFFCDFAAAMIKMGDIKNTKFKGGEIRKDCHKHNV